MAELRNWAGNVVFRAARVHRPESVAELRAVVAGADRVRALGSGHSFSEIADTTGDLVATSNLPRELDADGAAGTVRAGGGLRYAELAQRLHDRGLALHNMASLPHIGVVGACATATHGSGDGNGNLATAVAALEMVTADGDLVTLRRGDPGFAGAVVGLGALGVVVAVTLDVRPAFDLRQYVYEGLALDVLDGAFDEVFAGAYSVSLFTSWRDERFDQVWLKSLEPRPEEDFFGARPAGAPRHPVPGVPAVHCTPQLGEPGPWHERLPHFRADFTPSAGEELQTEYLLPRARALEALRSLAAVRERLAPAVQISEVRTIAADGLWLSTAYGADTVGLHFTWHPDPGAVLPLLDLLEERLAPLGGRPHWGKLFAAPPGALRARYPRLPDFQDLARRYDPRGKFRNEFLDRWL